MTKLKFKVKIKCRKIYEINIIKKTKKDCKKEKINK